MVLLKRKSDHGRSGTVMQRWFSYFAIGVFIFLHNNSFAQQIFISDAQKISTELVGYNILGETKNGDILIYKKYRFNDEVDIYDKQMTFKRRKEITLKSIDYETVEVYKSGDNIFHFYTVKDNKMNYLRVQKYTLDLEKKGEPSLLDSTSLRLGDNFSEFKVVRARGNTWFLVYKYELSNARIDKLFSMVVNEEGKNVQQNEVNLPDENYSPVLKRDFISDDGMPVFLFENDEFSCKKEKSAVQYSFILPKGNNAYLHVSISSNEYCLDEMNFGFDNVSGNITAVSFLKEDTRDYMLGYQFTRINPSNGEILFSKSYIFPQETLDEIAGLASEKSIRNLPVYQIGQVIPRMDGGALLISEYYDKTVESYEYTNYDPYYGYRTSTRQVEFYEYDDLLVFSIKPDGTPSWDNVVRKKQISREDRGVNSSYAFVNSKQKILFIFNEDVEQNSNVLQYELTADGTLDRKSLFNANQQEVQLRPSSAEQISFNTIIIPSIYKKALSFVKIQF